MLFFVVHLFHGKSFLLYIIMVARIEEVHSAGVGSNKVQDGVDVKCVSGGVC